jgi:hypothetical protein
MQLTEGLRAHLPTTYGSTAIYWALAANQFLKLVHSRSDSLDGGSGRHKAATLTHNNTNTEKTHTHPCLECDSNP